MEISINLFFSLTGATWAARLTWLRTPLQIFSLGLRLGTRSSTSTEAIAYAREVMDDFLSRPTLEEGSEQGVLGGKARWRVQVRTVRDPSRAPTLGSDL